MIAFQLINSFGEYSAAFLMRPVGATLFGEIGHRMLGRKNELFASIMLIMLPSVAMGLLTSREQLGALSPVLVVILRMIRVWSLPLIVLFNKCMFLMHRFVIFIRD